jgi:4-aminobutyrate aminotransferase-like enzyme/Ser/Thr protein kinase RdoA (MazF antagonist)
MSIFKGTEDDAIRLVAELYGLKGIAQFLPGEYDLNYHVVAEDGAEYVLKVMHPDREAGLIELQIALLAHLAESPVASRVPRVCTNLKGEKLAPLNDGSARLVWMLNYLPGHLMARANPHSPEMLRSLGRLLGEVDAALADFSHPAAQRNLKWDLARSGWIRDYLSYIDQPERRQLVETLLARFESEVMPLLPSMRTSVIHNDANDYNVLVGEARPLPREAVGLIDFGDALRTATVFEIAVAAAYALLGKSDPLQSAAEVVAGYHSAFPLRENEIDLLFTLVCTRLIVSVTNSAYRKTREPNDPYIVISERPAWEALEKLSRIHPRFARYKFREACGLPPVPENPRVVAWLKENANQCAQVLPVDLRTAPGLVLDLGVGSLLLGADPAGYETEAMTKTVFAEMGRAGAEVGIGRYDEARGLYSAPAFGAGHPTEEHRTIHLGIDLFIAPGTNVYAPLDGVVHCAVNNDARLDYGPMIILKHRMNHGEHGEHGEEESFFTLYGHLSEESLGFVREGQTVKRGERMATIGAPPINGDWTPHLHFQIILDLLDLGRDFPGVADAGQREIWKSLSPDPNLMLGIPADRFPAPALSKAETLALRKKHLGGNLSISYREPLKIVRGWKQYLYDDTGRAFLDVYNNVPLVGHSHPRIVRAVQRQMALLNTNTRYLHENIVRYADKLTSLMPEPLSVCYFLNSASEANELALRLARTHTGREDMIVLDAAYHGHTSSLIDISPYKFNGPGGAGRKPWVHIAPVADDYRGPYKRNDPDAGLKYAADVAAIIRQIGDRGFAGYIAETLPSVGGQIVFPPGYLKEVYRHVRAAGAVCIADEVQVGFGRLGTHFWGFETQDVVPDIVVLGKPIGNAFPLAAVVTTPEIAVSFNNGMEFFSTFGGNPVSCAAGLAVLEVMQEEKLQENALRVGGHLLNGLRELMTRHPSIGDVRGSGLFLGIELVRDRASLEPAADEAGYVVNRLRDAGILAGTDGPFHNVIKLRPPLIFSKGDADFLIGALDGILREDAALTPLKTVN